MNLTSVAAIVEIAILIAAALIAAWYAIRRLNLRRGAQPHEPIAAGAGEVAKYHPLLVVLHWSIAFAMAQLLVRGAFIMVNIPNTDPAKVDALRAHMLAGTAVLALMTARLAVRRATLLPPAASPRKPILDKLKHLVWPLLYVGVLAQASVGLAMAFQADLPGVLFGGYGSLPADFWIYPLRSVHYAVSRLLVVLIALHVAGAAYHTLILKDGLLRRMSFGGRRSPPAAQIAELGQGDDVTGRRPCGRHKGKIFGPQISAAILSNRQNPI